MPSLGKTEYAATCSLQRDLHRAQRDGQIRWNIAGHTELVRRADNLMDADAFGQLQRRDISRIGKGLE